MSGNICAELQGRVERLERERRFARLLLALFALSVFGGQHLVAAPAAGRVSEREVRAQKFIVVDDTGREVASLGTFARGTPWLSLWNESGEVSLIVEPDNGPRFSLWTGDRLGNVWLRLYKGAPEWTMRRDGHLRAEFGSDSAATHLTLFDPNNVPRATLGHVVLQSPRTEVTERRPMSSLVLFGKEGRVVWKAP